MIIGRESPSELIVPSPQVSARHAEIEHVRDDTYLITDLGSTNGTWVNGSRVQSSFVTLSDTLTLGSCPVDLRRWIAVIPRAHTGAPAQAASVRLPAPAAPPIQPKPPETPSAPGRQAVNAQPGLGTDLAVALAAQQSFTGKAFFVWVLYWFFWLPGVIMNFVYLSEAKRVQALTGTAPPGKGCLTFLIITHFWLGLFLLLLVLIFGVSALTAIFG